METFVQYLSVITNARESTDWREATPSQTIHLHGNLQDAVIDCRTVRGCSSGVMILIEERIYSRAIDSPIADLGWSPHCCWYKKERKP